MNILLQEQNENWYSIRRKLSKIADHEFYLHDWEFKRESDDYITRFIDHLELEQLNPTLSEMLDHVDSTAVLAACHYIGVNRIQGFEDKLWELSNTLTKIFL